MRTEAKWHLVESVIDGEPITKCGLRMAKPKTLEDSPVIPLSRMISQPQLCKKC
jgi:hypothetical protein